MASLTFWNRLEPRPRGESLADPLGARIRDPLWFLTRQRQLGEFLGADGGSPSHVELTTRTERFSAWSTEATTMAPLASAPLEEQALKEPFSPTLASRIELGQLFESLLTEQSASGWIDDFRTGYPIDLAPADPSDPSEIMLRALCGGRAIDGVDLFIKAAAALPGLPAAPSVPFADQGPVLAALTAFVAWVREVFGEPGEADPVAWHAERLEYGLDVATDAGTVLAGSPDDDGLFDWDAFDLRGRSRERPRSASVPTIAVPAHVRFRGMPNARFWDFESWTTDFGAVQPDRRDLARLAVMDFMLVHANDWFQVPVEQAIGTLVETEAFLVHDVFGGITTITRADREPGPSGRWTMFSTGTVGAPTETTPFFLLPPSAGSGVQRSEPIEEVRFVRDEMANIAWAIEHTTENAAGEPWYGRERDDARNPREAQPAPPQRAGVPLRYVIETRVPENWIPLLPVSVDPARGQVALERSAMLASDGATPIEPAGRLLRPPVAPYRIPEEEIPRTGRRVRRILCRSRWVDGSTHLWTMRESIAGFGEANSALRFDVPEPNVE